MIHIKATTTIQKTAGQGAAVNDTNRKIVFKNCAPFTKCVSAINNTRADDAQDIDIVMPMYSLIE